MLPNDDWPSSLYSRWPEPKKTAKEILTQWLIFIGLLCLAPIAVYICWLVFVFIMNNASTDWVTYK